MQFYLMELLEALAIDDEAVGLRLKLLPLLLPPPREGVANEDGPIWLLWLNEESVAELFGRDVVAFIILSSCNKKRILQQNTFGMS